MQLYFACLRYRCDVAENNGTLFEDSIRLLYAASLKSAEEKAAVLGTRDRVSYFNERGEKVVWKFCEVADVQEFSEEALADEVEVYSRLYRVGESPTL